MGAKKYVIMAVVSGLLAGVAVLGFLQQIWSAQTASVAVYVAAQDIAAGAAFDSAAFEVMKVSPAVAKAGAVPEGDDRVQGYVLSNGLQKGALLTYSGLSARAQSGSVAPSLSGEKRAIALASSAFLSPIPPVVVGDTVDVWVSSEGTPGQAILVASGLPVRDAVRVSSGFTDSGNVANTSAGSIDVIVLEVSAADIAALSSAEPGRLAIVACPSAAAE